MSVVKAGTESSSKAAGGRLEAKAAFSLAASDKAASVVQGASVGGSVGSGKDAGVVVPSTSGLAVVEGVSGDRVEGLLVRFTDGQRADLLIGFIITVRT